MNPEHETAFGFALPEDPAHRDRLAELGQLASGLVHELKNPLSAISLTVEMLLQQCQQDQFDNERTRRRLERIADGTKQLHNIVTSFLAFARPQRASHDRIDVNGILEDLVTNMDEQLQAHRIRVDLRLHPALSAVAADSEHLISVFRNILLNAVEALEQRDQDRRILIVTRNGRNEIRVMIANNGPALSATQASHLFDPFFSNKEGGTGLGLAIVKRLVEMHHGSITVSSSIEQGVSFTIEFPTTLGPARPLEELPSPMTEAHAEIRDE
ncbi:MAG: sensor histidine kinase [Planctomycetota bacterium]